MRLYCEQNLTHKSKLGCYVSKTTPWQKPKKYHIPHHRLPFRLNAADIRKFSLKKYTFLPKFPAVKKKNFHALLQYLLAMLVIGFVVTFIP